MAEMHSDKIKLNDHLTLLFKFVDFYHGLFVYISAALKWYEIFFTCFFPEAIDKVQIVSKTRI